MPHETNYLVVENIFSNTVQSKLLDALLELFRTHLENDLDREFLPTYGWPILGKLQRVNVENRGDMSFLHFHVQVKDQKRERDVVMLKATFAVKTET